MASARIMKENQPPSAQTFQDYREALRVAGELLFRLAAGHVALLHSVLGLARIEVVVADSKGIGAG
jgi:hypothetical protein